MNTYELELIQPAGTNWNEMQFRRVLYTELKAASDDLHEERGVRGFWLGYLPNIIRDVPFSAIYWGSYEAQKKIFNKQNEETSLLFSFVAGAIAGSIEGTATLSYKQIEMGEVDFKIKVFKIKLNFAE